MSHVGERWRTQTATLSGEDFTHQTDFQLSLSSSENREKPANLLELDSTALSSGLFV